MPHFARALIVVGVHATSSTPVKMIYGIITVRAGQGHAYCNGMLVHEIAG